MKSKKKYFIIGILVLILIGISIWLVRFYFMDQSKLNATEKRYLADNSSIVENIDILNNVSIFGSDGEGVFYDFLDDLYKEYSIKTNPVIVEKGETTNNISFTISNTIGDNDFIFYKGHYVLVGKNNKTFSSLEYLANQKIGVLADNLSHVSNFLENQSFTIQTFNTEDELLQNFQEQQDIEYIMVPLESNLSTILKNDYTIAYHFSDIPYYYKVNIGKNKTLGSILKKYFIKWQEKNFALSFKEHLFKLFIDSLNISLTEIDAMQSISYNYGFISNSPYEILTGGNYGGVIAQYLKEFTDFTDTEIKFTKYKNINKLQNAIKNNNVDFYFNFYTANNNYQDIQSNIPIRVSILADREDALVVNSLKSLKDMVVYVEENTALYDYLKNNTSLKLKTYKKESELKRLIKNHEIIIMDSNVYYAYRMNIFNEYSERYHMVLDNYYSFKTDVNETFNKLFTKYINYKDPAETQYKGIYNYEKTFRTGTITGAIAKYFMYILLIFILIFLYAYKFTKKVKLSKKIKKEDKLKYIDQLTSLKNRNYLTENLENWGKNTVYPQTIIVIDLNNLQYINDMMGYEQGDEQIKAAANILVKTQLDKSDIIRTDGNEFVIYLVGYEQKQIVSYIHKLNKEFNKELPYNQGAAIGYSMILDDIKSIEDAMNEAVEEVKRQKENKKEETNETI